MKKLLPLLLALLGIGGGVAAGIMLKPDLPPEVTELNTDDPCGEATVETAKDSQEAAEATPTTREYVKLNNQFIIPVVIEDRVNSLVVLSLSLEITQGQSQPVFDREPKLRDAFLQVLFNHANMGGFNGSFTETAKMDVLRRTLRDAGQAILGEVISDVLITDLARQDT